MLDEFVLDLGEGHIGPKICHNPLQRQRAAAIAHFGAIRKRANVFVPVAILDLFYGYFAERAVPLEFFLPPRHAPLSCPAISAALAA